MAISKRSLELWRKEALDEIDSLREFDKESKGLSRNNLKIMKLSERIRTLTLEILDNRLRR